MTSDGMSLLVILGYVGTFFYVFSYFLLNTKRLRGDSLLYIGMNMAAALLVLASMIDQFNGPSTVIQGVWVLISGYGIYRILADKKAPDLNVSTPLESDNK